VLIRRGLAFDSLGREIFVPMDMTVLVMGAPSTTPGVVFGKVNTEEEPELAGMFGIRSIPTLMILREKVILYSEAGALPAHALEDIVTKAQALDMVKVHEEIAKERSSDSDPDA